MDTLFRLIQQEKVPSSIVAILFGIFTVSMPDRKNVYLPIYSTLSGIDKLFNEISWNALSSIYFKLLGRFNLFNLQLLMMLLLTL